MSPKAVIDSQNAQVKYDKGVTDLIASLQYFTSSPKKSLVSRVLGLAKHWYEPVEDQKPNPVISPIKSIGKVFKVIFGSVTTVVSAVATAVVHPVYTHNLRKNLDKIQDPKVMSTLLSEEKFWIFAEKNIDSVRSIGLKNAPANLKGLLSDVLTEAKFKDLRSTFGNGYHKVFLNNLFEFIQDEKISKGSATLALTTDAVATLSVEDKEARKYALAKIKTFLTSPEFANCIKDVSFRNSGLFEAMAKNKPLKDMLDTYGVSPEFFMKLVSGPLREHPETINNFFEAYMSGRFVQNIIELSRDKQGYQKFIEENAQELRWPIDKFINENDWLKSTRDPLRKYLPNLDWAEVLKKVTQMSPTDRTSLVNTLDLAFTGQLTAASIPGLLYRHGKLLGQEAAQFIGQYTNLTNQSGSLIGAAGYSPQNNQEKAKYQIALSEALKSSNEPNLEKRLRSFYSSLSQKDRANNAMYKLMTNSLDYVELDKQNLSQTLVDNFTMFGSKITQTNFTGAKLCNSTFSDSKIADSTLFATSISNCSFNNVDFSGSKFGGAVISNCKFSGKITVDKLAFKDATIDIDSLNSLIKACEESKAKIDLSNITILGNPHEINIFSPAIDGFENAKFTVDKHSYAKKELQDYTNIELHKRLGVDYNETNIAIIKRLFQSPGNDIFAKHLSNNFKFCDSKELEQPETAAYKIKQLVKQSYDAQDKTINEEILKTKLSAQILAEAICKKIYGEHYSASSEKVKEEKLIADFMNKAIQEQGMKLKDLEQLFQIDEAGNLSVKNSELLDVMSKVLAGYNFRGVIISFVALEAIKITEDNLRHPGLQQTIKSLLKLQKADLQGLEVSVEDYLQIKEAYRKSGKTLNEEVIKRYEFKNFAKNLGLKDDSLENRQKVLEVLTTPNNWLSAYIKEKLVITDNILSRDELKEKQTHFSGVKDSSELMTTDLKASVHNGAIDVNEFKLRLVANKFSDQISEKLFGYGNNRAADCLLLQEVVYNALNNAEFEKGDPDKKLAYLIDMFETPDKIKPQFEHVIEELASEIKKEYCVSTTVGILTGGIQLDINKVEKTEVYSDKKSIIQICLDKLLDIPAKTVPTKKSAQRFVPIDEERFAEVAKTLSEEIGQELWGTGNRKADIVRLAKFIQTILSESQPEQAMGVLNNKEAIRKAITPLIKENALCSTAMGWLGTGGTQLKVSFETKELKSKIFTAIAKQQATSLGIDTTAQGA